jgi:hypothetical protein
MHLAGWGKGKSIGAIFHLYLSLRYDESEGLLDD